MSAADQICNNNIKIIITFIYINIRLIKITDYYLVFHGRVGLFIFKIKGLMVECFSILDDLRRVVFFHFWMRDRFFYLFNENYLIREFL